MPLQIDVAWSQIVGARKNQQDSATIIRWPNGVQLLILADGMGGHAGGEIASRLVVDSFRDSFVSSETDDFRERLIESLEAANVAVYQHIRSNPEVAGMGSTVIGVYFEGESIQWVSVGDSPMWLVRNGELKRLNENHSVAAQLAEKVAAGQMSQAEAESSPERSQLLEAIMGVNIDILDAPEDALVLEAGDTLILASDGVESCSDEQLLEIVEQHTGTAEDIAADVLDAVQSVGRPKQDNASLIVMKVFSDIK